MKDRSYPIWKIIPVLQKSLSLGLAVAMREGINGKLMAQLLDPHLDEGRERFYDESFAWAASDLPQRLKRQDFRRFDFFVICFLVGLMSLRTLFPDCAPVSRSLQDLRALLCYMHSSADSLTEHRKTLDRYRKSLTSDFEETSVWFAGQSGWNVGRSVLMAVLGEETARINRHTSAVGNDAKRLIRADAVHERRDKRTSDEREMIDQVIRPYLRLTLIEQTAGSFRGFASSVFRKWREKCGRLPFETESKLRDAARYDLEHFYDISAELAKLRAGGE